MSSEDYFDRALGVLEAIRTHEAGTIERVAESLVACIRDDRMIYTFGSGHSSLLASEGLFRAGGLACVSAMLEPTTTFAVGAIASSMFERRSGMFRSVIERYPVEPGDALVVFSNSGVNALPVELTAHCRERGLTTVAITSRQYAALAPRSSPEGRSLDEVADYVIDNHVPPGDAMISIGATGHQVAAASTLAGAFIWNALIAEVAARLDALRLPTPGYVSSNMAGAKEVNAALVDRYRHRVRNL